jgi:hypothetical protein
MLVQETRVRVTCQQHAEQADHRRDQELSSHGGNLRKDGSSEGFAIAPGSTGHSLWERWEPSEGKNSVNLRADNLFLKIFVADPARNMQ